MALGERWQTLWPLGVALALAGAWPFTAQAVHPLALPVGIGVLGLAALALRRLELGIAATLALVPFSDASIGPLADIGLPSSPVEPLLMGLAGGLLVAAYLLPDPTPRRRDGLPLALLAVLTIAVLSALAGLEPRSSLGELARLFQAAALLLATRRICREREQVALVIGGALLGLLLAGGQGLAQAATGSSELYGFDAGGEIVARVQGSFFHPNEFGIYVAILLPLAASVLLAPAMTPRLRILAGIALAVGAPALVLSYSRGAMLGLVLGGLAWLAVTRPRRVLPVAAVAVLLALAVAPSALPSR
nr:hypothetical protein [Solirubrobacterales bacterium]